MEETKKHSIYLCERKEVIIEGVVKLDSFDNKEFLIDTTSGYVHIKGNNLSLGVMDMEKGILSIFGTIDSIVFLDKSKSDKKEGFFTKLFK